MKRVSILFAILFTMMQTIFSQEKLNGRYECEHNRSVCYKFDGNQYYLYSGNNVDEYGSYEIDHFTTAEGLTGRQIIFTYYTVNILGNPVRKQYSGSVYDTKDLTGVYVSIGSNLFFPDKNATLTGGKDISPTVSYIREYQGYTNQAYQSIIEGKKEEALEYMKLLETYKTNCVRELTHEQLTQV